MLPMAQPEKKRISLYDNLKFVLIVLVVLGHFIEPFTNVSQVYKALFLFIYSFHMPLFIFIAGHFHDHEKALERATYYFILGLIAKLIYVSYPLIIHGDTPSTNLFDGSGLHWFMMALAAFNIILYIFKGYNKLFLMLLAVLLALLTGYDDSVGDLFQISRIIVYLVFYIAGSYVTEDTIQKCKRFRLLNVLSVCALIAILILTFIYIDKVYFLRPLFTGRNPYSVNERFTAWGGVAYRLICFFIASTIGFCFIVVTPSKQMPIITEFGTRTLQVYLLHYLFFKLLRETPLDEHLCSTATGKCLWMLIACLVTVVLCIPKIKTSSLVYLKKSNS